MKKGIAKIRAGITRMREGMTQVEKHLVELEAALAAFERLPLKQRQSSRTIKRRTGCMQQLAGQSGIAKGEMSLGYADLLFGLGELQTGIKTKTARVPRPAKNTAR